MSTRRDLDELRRRRMRAAEWFEQGATQADVARRLEVSRTSVMRWYLVWRARGESGLEGAGRAGRRRRLGQRQIERLQRELLRGPRAHGHKTEFWTLPRVAQVIERVTGARYHPGHVWRVMRQLG